MEHSLVTKRTNASRLVDKSFEQIWWNPKVLKPGFHQLRKHTRKHKSPYFRMNTGLTQEKAQSKYKYKDLFFFFSLCLPLCLRSLVSCENETHHKKNKEICYGWQIKALAPDSPRPSIWKKWRMPWLILMLMSTFAFTSISFLCLCLSLR